MSALAPGGWLVLSHMRLLKDDVSGHRRTVSGYPRMGAASVHPVFKSHPHLCLVRENLQPLYAICVLERGRGDRGARRRPAPLVAPRIRSCSMSSSG